MIELVFLVGMMWAVSRGFDTTRSAVKARTAAARKRTPDPHKRRAARQAATGWWLGEALHLFPTTRHGLAAGWENHRDAWHQRQVETAKRRADHTERRVGWQAEIAAHLHRLEIAAAKYKDGPSMSDQLRAAVAAARRRLDPAPDPGPEPDPDGEHCPLGSKENREAPVPAPAAGCKNPSCTCHAGSKAAPNGSGNGSQPGGSSTMTDINYEQTLETCDQAAAAAEEGVNSEALTKVTSLVDGLGAMLRSDPDSCGLAADAAQAAADVKQDSAKLIDAIGALKSGVTTKYGPQQDALDAAGVGQPAEGFLEH